LHASGKEEYEGWLAERRNMKEATKQGGGSGASKVEKQTSNQTKNSRLADICHSSNTKPVA
jgi:hypothetical protein